MQILNLRLRREHTIEGVAMIGRISPRHERMPPGNIEHLKATSLQELAEMSSEIRNLGKFPKPLFGADLPNARGADEDLVCWISDDLAYGTAQARAVSPPPNQRVGIEQHPHPFLPSQAANSSSGKGSKNSSPRTPLISPGLRGS
jgi:hypothetical protein